MLLIAFGLICSWPLKPVIVIAEDKESIGKFADYKSSEKPADKPDKAEKDKADKAAADKEKADKAAADKEKADKAATDKPAADKDQAKPKEKPSAAAFGRIVASPRAKVIAAESGVSLSGIEGSGPSGRIVAADVEAAAKSAPAAAAASSDAVAQVSGAGDYTELPLSNIRKVCTRETNCNASAIAHLICYRETVVIYNPRTILPHAPINRPSACPTNNKQCTMCLRCKRLLLLGCWNPRLPSRIII
jgi:pyruvate/2-oxoglutarate dehydrogenase complex dihydrolipoamide acyltransferase (E2) component